ncbi:MAG: RNA-binding protein [Bacteroidetes bacterium]|nr:RNA-binding protein [Bacteroidota bacterium]MDA0903967.1 RNA-binding protein [Bacteroidota bacterium]MDA1243147.1 RNA-binding protein [Bacteroidota bacterium]
MKLFVAKLNREAKDSDLKAWFEAIGPVKSAKVVMDRDSGQSKCFGFVEMERREDGQRAISELDGKPMMDFRIVIKEAEDRPRSGPGGDRPRGSAPHRGDGSSPRSGRENAATGRSFSGPEDRGTGASTGPFFGDDSKPKKVVKKKAGKGRPDKYADGPRSVKMKRGGKGGARPQYGDFDDDF